jgi:hypothetical protein
MARQLPDSDLIGLGFDILGEYSAKSRRSRIVTAIPADGSTTYSYAGNEYNHPQGVSVFAAGTSDLSTSTSTFESKREVQNHFSVKANVKGTYGGFSGQADALFRSDTETDESFWYGLEEARLEAFTMSLDSPKPSADWLQDEDVMAMLKMTRYEDSDAEVFFRVFRKYGTHVITGGTVGANLYYAATVQKSAATSRDEVGVKVSAEYKAVAASIGGGVDVEWSSLGKTWASERTIVLAVTGGIEAKLFPAAHPGFGDNFAQVFTDWEKTIPDNPRLIDFDVMRISELFSGTLADAIDEAIDAYTGKGVYASASIAPQELSGYIEVSGRVIEQRKHAGSGGAQLVVVDATTLTELYNHTVFGAEDPSSSHLWDELYAGIPELDTSDYICALTVFNWHANMSPTGDLQHWLKRCGATLQSWENVGAHSSTYVAYAFIGRSDCPPGQGLEQLDYQGHGGPISFASVVSALVPRHGRYDLPATARTVATA